jgi:hypothetical protein
MVTVGQLLVRARLILQEITQDGTRWTNAELVNWLNEAYSGMVDIIPSAFTVVGEMTLVAGTRQTIPDEAERLIDVIRNTSSAAGGEVVTRTTMSAMNLARRRWHAETATASIENFMFDDMSQRSFYVYPPALPTAKLEILYTKAPEAHAATEAKTDSVEPLKLSDSYAPILLDLVLARAYAKDSESQANAARATMHTQAAQSAMALKVQALNGTSPNAKAGAQPQ